MKAILPLIFLATATMAAERVPLFIDPDFGMSREISFTTDTISTRGISFEGNTTEQIVSSSNAISMSTSGITRMVIDANGDVGIGSTNPKGRLHILGSVAVSTAATNADDLVIENSVGTVGISLLTVDVISAFSLIVFGHQNNNDAASIIYIPGSTDLFAIGRDSNPLTLVIDSDSLIGIQNATPSAYLEISTNSQTVIDPFMISSTDVVDGDYFIVKGTGLVGINETVPQTQLEVSGTISATDLQVSGIVTATNGTFSNRVGIATTIPQTALEVSGTISASDLQVSGIITATDGAFTNLTVSSAATVGSNFTVDTSTLVVNATTNRVGIGTTSPASILEVETATDPGIRFSDTTDSQVWSFFYDTSGNRIRLRNETSATDRMSFTTGGGAEFNTTSAIFFRTVTNGNGVLRLSGPVGVAGRELINMAVTDDASSDTIKFIEGIVDSDGTPFETFMIATSGMISTTAGAIFDSDNSGDNVGIGITSPLAALHVSGNISTTQDIETITTNTGIILGGLDTNRTTIRSGSSGFVQVMGAQASIDWNNRGLTDGRQFLIRHNGDLVLTLQGGATAGSLEVGDARFNKDLEVLSDLTVSARASITDDLEVDTNTLYVDASANSVGIGITTPDAKLHIQGSDQSVTPASTADMLHVEDSFGGITISGQSGVGESTINFADSADNDAGSVRYSHVTNDMTFRTNGSNKMTLDDAGSLGIGTTSPETTLSVVGSSGTLDIDGNTTQVAVFFSSDVGEPGIRFVADQTNNVAFWQSGLNNGDFAFGTRSGSSNFERIRIKAAGNVGIGTTSPGAKLEVSGPVSITGTGSNLTVSNRVSAGIFRSQDYQSQDGSSGLTQAVDLCVWDTDNQDHETTTLSFENGLLVTVDETGTSCEGPE